LVTGEAVAVVPPSLEALLEQSRKQADAGGSEGDQALLRWEFLSRVLRDVAPPPGPTLEELGAELKETRLRLTAFREDPAAAEVGARDVTELSSRISARRELQEEWLVHRRAVQAELGSFREELRLAGRGRKLDPDLERRALGEAVVRFETFETRAQRGEKLCGKLVEALEAQYSELRLRERAEEKDLDRKRAELKALEKETRTRAVRAAELLRKARATERKAEEAQKIFEARKQEIEDGEAQRIYGLKAALEGEQKDLALERGLLARAEQALAEARATRKRNEIRYLGRRRDLEESGGPPLWVKGRLEESNRALKALEAEEEAQQQRVVRARALLDRFRSVRRGYRQREEDLLAPDLPASKKGAGWVLRTILSVLDQRETLAEDLRDRHSEILEEQGFRKRDELAWRETLEAALPRKQDLQRPRLQHLAELAVFFRMMTRRIRGGALRALGRDFRQRVFLVLGGQSLVPVWPSVLLALLLYLLVLRVLHLVREARLQAVLQAEAFDASLARRVRSVAPAKGSLAPAKSSDPSSETSDPLSEGADT
jgi:hypothetical protein